MSFQTASIDMQKIASMSMKVDRLKIEEGAQAVPIILLRRPQDTVYCTALERKHWLPDPSNPERSVVVPCGQSAAGGKCLVCDLQEEATRNGMINTLPLKVKDGLQGMTCHDAQVLDLRGHADKITRYQMALLQQKDMVAAQAALIELHDAMLKEPIKTWSFSRSVFNELRKSLLSFQQENLGIFYDPTDPAGTRLLWVTKEKDAGKKMATYHVRFQWNLSIPLPEAMFNIQPDGTAGPDSPVRSYDEMFEEFTDSVRQWPESRVREVLAIAAESTVGSGQPPQLSRGAPSPLSLPPARNNLGFAPVVPPVSMTAPQPPMAPPVVVPVVAGASTSASALKCFGKDFDMRADRCRACPRKTECLNTAQEEMAKPTAPAQATMPQPPKADRAAPDPKVAAAVAAALAAASKS